MKRFLALFLVLVLAFSVVLVSCKDNTEDPEETEEEEFEGIGVGGTTTADPSSTTTAASTGKTNTEYTWTDDTNGTMVYVRVTALHVRTDTIVTDATAKSTIKFGESYKRIKYNDEWTQIEVAGGQYYVKSAFVTADTGSILFTDYAEPKTVYVNVETTLNLRETPYADNGNYKDNIAFPVKRGVALTCIGVSQDGNWVKVKYDADTLDRFLYCNTSYISETQPSTETSNTPAVTSPIAG
ncbi:MAG: hypothetical protein E7679_07230 [Ruminococcaceae bacterium]|nr:hypothetical protein [Oscillospiraceae bacterium]